LLQELALKTDKGFVVAEELVNFFVKIKSYFLQLEQLKGFAQKFLLMQKSKSMIR